MKRERESVAERTAFYAVRDGDSTTSGTDVGVNLIWDRYRIATVVTTTRGDNSSSPAGSTTTGSDVGAIAPGDRPHREACERRPRRETASAALTYLVPDRIAMFVGHAYRTARRRHVQTSERRPIRTVTAANLYIVLERRCRPL